MNDNDAATARTRSRLAALAADMDPAYAAIVARVAHATVREGLHALVDPRPVSAGAEPAARMAAIAYELSTHDAFAAKASSSCSTLLLEVAAEREEVAGYVDEAVSLLLRNLREGMEVRLAAASDHVVRRLLDAITPVAGRPPEIAAVRALISSLVRAGRHDDAWRLTRAANRLCHRADLRRLVDDLGDRDRSWMRGRVANDTAHAGSRAA